MEGNKMKIGGRSETAEYEWKNKKLKERRNIIKEERNSERKGKIRKKKKRRTRKYQEKAIEN